MVPLNVIMHWSCASKYFPAAMHSTLLNFPYPTAFVLITGTSCGGLTGNMYFVTQVFLSESVSWPKLIDTMPVHLSCPADSCGTLTSAGGSWNSNRVSSSSSKIYTSKVSFTVLPKIKTQHKHKLPENTRKQILKCNNFGLLIYSCNGASKFI